MTEFTAKDVVYIRFVTDEVQDRYWMKGLINHLWDVADRMERGLPEGEKERIPEVMKANGIEGFLGPA